MSSDPGKAPAKIQIGGVSYSRSDEWVAIPLAKDASPPANARFLLENDGIAVVPKSPAVEAAEDVRPVYRIEPGGHPAVPTGRVFVRLREGEPANERNDDFARAGYVIENIPAWAPHTAWLRPASGGIVAALNGMERLRSLTDVENVEPQLLRPRTPR
jgi:hypothetical protein